MRGVATNFGVFFRTSGDGVCDFRKLDDVDRGLGVNSVSLPIRDDAKRFAAGDMAANRSNVERMCGEAIFRRAVSSAFAF